MAAAAALAFGAAASTAEFGVGAGFSGRLGFDCTSCHFAPAAEPFPPATMVTEGFPETWTPGQTYEATVQVLGGPPENPVPVQPKGGFSVEADQGSFGAAPGMEAYVRLPSPTEATYSEAGALMRTWRVTWTAPALTYLPPEPVNFWLAGLAVDGNHIVGQDDTRGEYNDYGARTSWVTPPSQQAIDGWRAMPLPAPAIEGLPSSVTNATDVRVSISFEATAERVEYRIDEGAWTPLPESRSFDLPDLPTGNHTVDARTWWGDRSAQTTATITVIATEEATPPKEAASLGVWLLLVALAGAAARRR